MLKRVVLPCPESVLSVPSESTWTRPSLPFQVLQEQLCSLLPMSYKTLFKQQQRQ